MSEKELPVCPSCGKAHRMKIDWLHTRTEGIVEIEVVKCQKCGWTGLKSEVTDARSKNQDKITEYTKKEVKK